MTSAVAAEPVPIEKSAGEVWLITGTRVPLETVVAAFTDGATPEEIVCQYPALSLPDVYQVISYFLHHEPEVRDYLAGRRKQAETVRAENEARFSPDGVRDRLLARKP